VGDDSALSQAEDEFRMKIDKMEDIMSSRLSICAITKNNKLPGRVTRYDSILHEVNEMWAHPDLPKQIRILGQNLSVSLVTDIYIHRL
jgi:hypothetical protein